MECHHSELLSKVVQLTTDKSPDLRPAWRADGTRLAFYSGRSGYDDIWAINTDGSDEVQLTDDPSRDRRPAWSPDGSKIVFDSDRAGSQDIWIMDADGSNQKQLTINPGSEMFASFDPTGSQIIFYGYEAGRNDIWTIDLDGGNLRALTSNLADETKNQCTFACHTPAFSPDGKSIAFDADQDGSRNIWVMDADGNNPRQLTTTNTNTDINNYLPAWSPDGRIIFQAERPVALTIQTDIRMINPDGSDEITVFTEVAHGGPFIWSPDGTQVALHSQRGGAGNFDIFVATFGEATEEQAPEPENAQEENLSPEEIAPEEDTLEQERLEQESPAEEPSASEEVVPSSEATTEATAESFANNTGFMALAGVVLLGVLGVVVFYGLRKFRRN
jgi:Tol biopolymer transport system component